MLFFVTNVNFWYIVSVQALQMNRLLFSNATEDGSCNNRVNKMFPFSDLTDQELNFNLSGVHDDIIDLFKSINQITLAMHHLLFQRKMSILLMMILTQTTIYITEVLFLCGST